VPRLVAFDLDGTLVDSRQDLADSANQLVVERGGAPISLDAVTAMVGEGAALLVRRALTAAGLSAEDPGALRRFLEIYDGRLLATTALYPGIVDAVRAARTGARVVVLTNKPLHHSERLLAGLGVRDLFDDVVGGDNPNGRKPAPQGLMALMTAAGTTGRDTLMVGDSLVDLETARAAGARCCLASFGFGYARISPSSIGDDTWVAASGTELAALLRQFVGTPGRAAPTP
jgi:phosphoglycolate phosphatase